VVLATTDGRVLTGILKADTPEAVEIQDAEAQPVRVPRDEIEDRRTGDVSLMPSGLAEGLTRQDFADLIAYLTTLRDAAPKSAGGR
jgi:putative heme-binding domain-containing protein